MKMMKLLGSLAPFALVAAAGCMAEPLDDAADGDEALAADVDAIRTANSLETLDLVANGITGNADALALFIARPLAFEGLPAGDLVRVQLHDERSKRFMPYLVGCALRAGQSVTYVDPFGGGKKTWKGQLGLCPAWKTGAPDEACLEAVSACLLARNNPNGVEVSLSLHGHKASGSALVVGMKEAATYDVVEGGFFGNIFDPAGVSASINRTVFSDGTVRDLISALPGGTVLDVFPRMWSCHADTWLQPELYRLGRVCTVEQYGGKTVTLCAARAAGACDTVCTSSDGAPVLGDHDWQGCQGTDGVDPAWHNVLTVFLDDPCAVVPFSFACMT